MSMGPAVIPASSRRRDGAEGQTQEAEVAAGIVGAAGATGAGAGPEGAAATRKAPG